MLHLLLAAVLNWWQEEQKYREMLHLLLAAVLNCQQEV
jgi:hypothetical protein